MLCEDSLWVLFVFQPTELGFTIYLLPINLFSSWIIYKMGSNEKLREEFSSWNVVWDHFLLDFVVGRYTIACATNHPGQGTDCWCEFRNDNVHFPNNQFNLIFSMETGVIFFSFPKCSAKLIFPVVQCRNNLIYSGTIVTKYRNCE